MSLSWRSYLILAAIALLGIAGQWLGGHWRLWWLLAAACWLGVLVWERWRLRDAGGLMFRWPVPGTAQLGKRFDMPVQVDNTAGRAIEAEWQPWLPEDLQGGNTRRHLVLAPGASQVLRMRVTPLRLGLVESPVVYIRLRGEAGLAWWRQPPERGGAAFRVLPARLNEAGAAAGVSRYGSQARESAGAGPDFLGLRDYRPGDPLRAVDWKATARTGRRIVRTFSEERGAELLLVLDLGYGSGVQAGPLSHLHHYVNAASRLAEQATAAGDRCGLLAFADDVLLCLAPTRGERGLRRVRDGLAELRSIPRESNPLKAALEVRRLLGQRALVVWFCELEDPETSSQLLRANALMVPKHLPLMASVAPEDVAEMAEQSAREWLDPYRNYAAQTWLHDRRRMLERLQRLGVETVHAPAARLDEAVRSRFELLRRHRRV